MFILRMLKCFITRKSINLIQYNIRLNYKTLIVISIGTQNYLVKLISIHNKTPVILVIIKKISLNDI